MVFGTLTRISLGAAAGVYAEKNGYVDQGAAAFAEQYGAAAEQYGLPALPKFGMDDVKMPDMPAVPTTVPTADELQARVAAALDAAKELFNSAMRGVLGGKATPEIAAELAVAAPTTNTKVSFRLSCFSTLLLLGAGTAAVVYYFGVEESKQVAEDGLKKVRAWSLSCAKWLDAKIAAAGLKPYRDMIAAHLSVIAVHAGEIAAHPQVQAAKAATVEFVCETVVPAVKSAATSTAELAKPYVAAASDFAAPHAEKLQKAVSNLIAAISAKLK